MINQRLHGCVTEVNNISDRLMSIKIIAGPTTIRVVTCYAPQTGCRDEEKDEFWEELDAYLRLVDPEEHLLIGGDLNGHVGATRDGYEQCHGGQGFGDQNDDGRRTLDCAMAHDLAIANTYFKKRQTHLITYVSGGTSTQIDYWMLRRRDLKLVQDAKVIPSDNIGPQHRLLTLDRRMPNHLKAKIYKTVVRPVALYGAECWPASTKHHRALHAMEMCMLLWSLGLTRLDQVMNEDIRKVMGEAPITEKMREARLRWYGHVVRSDEDSVARTAMRLSPEGSQSTRKAGEKMAGSNKGGHQGSQRRPGRCLGSEQVEENMPESGPRAKTGQTLGKKKVL